MWRLSTLTAHSLSVDFGSRPALAAVSLVLAPGEMVGLVGPNGCGKTTLVRALSGAIKPTAGEVLLDGRPPRTWGRQAWAQRVAVVGQDPLPDLEFTVVEVVALGRYPHLGRWQAEGETDRQAVATALADTGTTSLADRRIGSLSGGERQRVALARALAQGPEFLLLDEPSSHLDIHYQMEAFDGLSQLAARGLAVVAVLHDLNLAALYCRRLVLMSQGRVVADGATGDVLQAHVLEGVYGRPVVVRRHPTLDVPQVALLPADRLPGILRAEAGPEASGRYLVREGSHGTLTGVRSYDGPDGQVGSAGTAG